MSAGPRRISCSTACWIAKMLTTKRLTYYIDMPSITFHASSPMARAYFEKSLWSASGRAHTSPCVLSSKRYFPSLDPGLLVLGVAPLKSRANGGIYRPNSNVTALASGRRSPAIRRPRSPLTVYWDG